MEDDAKVVFGAMREAAGMSTTPEWTDGGNSVMQNIARAAAATIEDNLKDGLKVKQLEFIDAAKSDMQYYPDGDSWDFVTEDLQYRINGNSYIGWMVFYGFGHIVNKNRVKTVEDAIKIANDHFFFSVVNNIL